MITREERCSPRPYGTRKRGRDAIPGLRYASSGAIFVPSLREGGICSSLPATNGGYSLFCISYPGLRYAPSGAIFIPSLREGGICSSLPATNGSSHSRRYRLQGKLQRVSKMSRRILAEVPQGLKPIVFRRLSARSNPMDEKASMDSCFPMSENPDMGHPASMFSSPWVCRSPMETRLKSCPGTTRIFEHAPAISVPSAAIPLRLPPEPGVWCDRRLRRLRSGILRPTAHW